MDKNKWFAYVDMKWIAPRTNRQYKQLGRRILKYWDGDNFTQASVDNFYTELVKGTKPGNNVNVLYRAFIKNYITCYEDDVEDAGMRRIKLVSVGSRSRKKLVAYKFLTYDELCDMLSRLNSPQLLVMTMLLFETGLRASEITAIKREDIDMVGHTISGVGKGNKEYKLSFSDKMADILVAWFRHCPIEEYPFKIFKRRSPILRLNQGQGLYDFMVDKLQEIGFKHVTPHMIRHSFAHFLRHDKHLDLMEVKTALRHSSVTSTEIYAPATWQEVDDKIRTVVFGEVIDKPAEPSTEVKQYLIDYAKRIERMYEQSKVVPKPETGARKLNKVIVIYGDKRNYLAKIIERINFCDSNNIPLVGSLFGLYTTIVDRHKDRIERHRWSIHYTSRL